MLSHRNAFSASSSRPAAPSEQFLSHTGLKKTSTWCSPHAWSAIGIPEWCRTHVNQTGAIESVSSSRYSSLSNLGVLHALRSQGLLRFENDSFLSNLKDDLLKDVAHSRTHHLSLPMLQNSGKSRHRYDSSCRSSQQPGQSCPRTSGSARMATTSNELFARSAKPIVVRDVTSIDAARTRSSLRSRSSTGSFSDSSQNMSIFSSKYVAAGHALPNYSDPDSTFSSSEGDASPGNVAIRHRKFTGPATDNRISKETGSVSPKRSQASRPRHSKGHSAKPIAPNNIDDRVEDESGGDNASRGDDGESDPPQKSNSVPAPDHDNFMICPFLLRDFDKHFQCLFADVYTIAGMKQHIRRYHTWEHFCETCFRNFQCVSRLRAHTVSRTCVSMLKPADWDDKITDRRFQDVRKRQRSGSEPDKYKVLYKRVFGEQATLPATLENPFVPKTVRKLSGLPLFILDLSFYHPSQLVCTRNRYPDSPYPSRYTDLQHLRRFHSDFHVDITLFLPHASARHDPPLLSQNGMAGIIQTGQQFSQASISNPFYRHEDSVHSHTHRYHCDTGRASSAAQDSSDVHMATQSMQPSQQPQSARMNFGFPQLASHGESATHILLSPRVPPDVSLGAQEDQAFLNAHSILTGHSTDGQMHYCEAPIVSPQASGALDELESVRSHPQGPDDATTDTGTYPTVFSGQYSQQTGQTNITASSYYYAADTALTAPKAPDQDEDLLGAGSIVGNASNEPHVSQHIDPRIIMRRSGL